VNDRIAAVIVAAGQSSRFGAAKILTPIAGGPAILSSLRAFADVPSWSSIALVVNAELRATVESLLESSTLGLTVMLVGGGERRQDSVAAGLDAIGDAGIVVIHDGARPLVTPRLIGATIAAVRAGADAAVAGIPVADTLKRATGDSIETVDRSNLWRAQTPQAFRVDRLRSALAEIERRGLSVTDEAMAIELTGGRVTLVHGDEQNMKLTTPADARVIEALATQSTGTPRPVARTGIGYDVHRLVPGRRLILGGVDIPFELGLEGHSDADVLLHAIADAILGACALGDIGQHFPPSDEAYRGISSVTLLERSAAMVGEAGFQIVNIDATVIAEAPKIGPHAAAMQVIIANALSVDTSCVSIKATTNEQLGFAGRREGIAAMAIATVQGMG
jgi:2-C-methyl-D-erythritol 4-phosphate cytidylyltransferase/2-C-methyl-D-erythritol 2,4-cyclodiphosphate synthase